MIWLDTLNFHWLSICWQVFIVADPNMVKNIIICAILFLLVDFTVMFAFFQPEWFITNIGGHVQIGLWQTCITTTRNVTRCFIFSSFSTEWVCAIVFILIGSVFATITAVTFLAAFKIRTLAHCGRWFGLATLVFYCLASICIPMGFTMEAIQGEPFQLPTSYQVSSLYLQ